MSGRNEGTADPWADLRRLTPARIALGRVGASLPTSEVLAFALAHARARDAVHAPFDAPAMAQALEARGHPVIALTSAAPDRPTYLRRPDLGRRLSSTAREALRGWATAAPDLAIVVADGLSATAVEARAVPLLSALAAYPRFAACPVVVASQARVALGDDVGECLGAAAVLVLIGERPGLSSPDSLGAYFTFGPRIGRTDADRNCVSNIRPEGLSDKAAAARIAWLVDEAFRRGTSGVMLKDESNHLTLAAAPAVLSLDAP